MFPVLLHPDLYQMLRLTRRPVRARVRKTLLRLRDGHWGGGTRVKRLRGVGRPLYEARTDDGDRLLFTVARSAAGDHPDRLVAHLQVWDLVEHDDVVRVARRNRAPEAEFLELETLEEFEIHEPPPHPGAELDEMPAETAPGGAGVLLHFLLPPESFKPRSTEAINGGVRWYRLDPACLAGEEDFQRLLDGGGEELELKLTREQYEVLRAPGPVLLAGSAGSGKTTIAAHRLLQATREAGGRALFLSYSGALVERARSLYGDLAAVAALALGHSPELGPDFFSFGDLYRSMVPREYLEHQARPMNETLFREWFRKAGRPLDPALVWEELRSILKGACLSPARPMLSAEDYFELGRKRAPLFVELRPEIYRIAERYQEWLAEEGRSDRIDLCRRALAELRRRRGPRYDVVVCDEVQDLTEIEVSFVLALSARPDLAGLLLAGDTQQIVNPSGFRWAEVRRLAARHGHARTAPPLLRLQRNLRSVRPIVELANALLLLRREVFGRGEEDEIEEAAIQGPVPIEIPAAEEEALGAISGFGPRCVVLTLDDEESERLKRRLDTSRVLHVREAKGLEFETVVLWKLLGPDRDLVERFARGDARLEREARFARLLRHLYVAATRARRHLAIYEGSEAHFFWGQGRFHGLVERQGIESLSHLLRPGATPADWLHEGDYFAERGHFRQAAECFRRAGASDRESESLAHAGEAIGDWRGALDHWTRLGAASREAPLLERLGRLEDAARRYREAGLARDARRCELLQMEGGKAWKEAALGWEELACHADAARCWSQAGDRRRATAAEAREAEAAGDPAGAGAHWLEIAAWQDAARCFRAAGDQGRTALALARHHEAAGEWAAAAACYRRAGERSTAARCRARAHEAAGRLGRAARIWELLGEDERATELLARAEQWLAVARLERVGGGRLLLSRIGDLLGRGDWRGAAPLIAARLEALRPRLPQVPWFVAGEQERQAWHERGNLLALEHRCAALRAEEEQAWSRAARRWRQAGDSPRAAEALRRRIEGLRDPRRRARARAAEAAQASATARSVLP
jgi:tetratricopeptide (TPR) repeat protein